ncbi:polymorphic toxin-type HINT domain-containing protein [Streptomyces sp. CC228A]|uniref:polymorphic toxin-type HINT domain-containing protein n=1 Tax=Streptomyces sp. CC228A TaxID=2898186 RepID=UPI001F20F9A7|nr:polymorphic toxin-type HINT domain-containing protein [Streptomyces sp. CC228A]
MPESLNRLSPHAVSRAASRWSSAAVRRRRRTARARRLGVALSAVLAATLLPAEAWAIAPPAPRSGPVLDALQQEEPADPDQAKMEELSAWSGSAVEPPTVFDPTAITPPAGGTAPVTLDGAGEDLVPVGTLPVSIGKASPTEADPNPPAPSGTWDVAVEPRTSTEAADVDGALITVTPPESGSTPVDIELDYGQFEDLFGTEWSSRLKLTQLPQCFLTTPELEECTTPVDVPSSNDPSGDTVRATVDPAASQAQGLSTQSGGGPVVLAATDSAAGAGGTYKATPLSATGTWSAGGSSGGFSWTYPLPLPEPPAGPAPKVALSYSSQSVDGRTSVANGQASWIGDGWDYHPGFIERRYRSCDDDRSGTPNNDNSTHKKKSDLCWAGDNVVMSLGGSATSLVRDDATGKWVAQNDTGARIEYKAKDGSTKAAQTGKYDGEHWIVTTPDGTRYWFGRGTLPGRATATNSTATVPVFGNHSGEPCHATAYADSSCTQAWRWNLDYVEDVHGNAMIVDWKKEQNRYAKNEKFAQAVSYDRDSYPTQILYGLRADDLDGAPAGKVVFKTAQRCDGDSATCSDTKFESKNYQDKQPWWDTPSTLHCKVGAKNCYVTAPTFWSRVKLEEVETYGQRTPGSTALSPVDTWTLKQSFPKQRTDTHPPLWLESITRTGHNRPGSPKEEADKVLPPVVFLPNVEDMPNRVAKSATDETPDFDRLRVETIRTETGGEIHVDYSDHCPVGTEHPSPASNTTRCFPVHWSADAEAFTDERMSKDGYQPPVEWFNKYVVEAVTEKDRVARQPDVTTTYTYEGGGAWAKNTDEFTKPALRTYDQWRGYAGVVTKKGVTSADQTAHDATQQSQTRTRYFRGMSGDAGRDTVTVKDSTGTETLGEDLLPYQGMPAETLTYTKAGGTLVSRTLSWPYGKETASRARTGLPALKAYRTATSRTDTVETISEGRTRTQRTQLTFDPTYGVTLTAQTLTLTPNGTGSMTTGDEKCTTTSYVHNTAKHLIGLPHHSRTTVGTCAEAATATGTQIISAQRVSYDALAAFGTAPLKGLPFQVDTVDADGTGWVTSARTVYDALGRSTKVTDAAGHATTVAYTPATGPAFQTASTNAAGHTTTTALDPARGTALSVTDANGRKTSGTFDALGRATAVWSPSRTQGTDAASAKFEYQIEDNEVPSVRTLVLRDNGTYSDTVEIYDGLMRPRQTQTEALGGGRIITETLYNANGTAQETRNAYLADGEPETQLFAPLSLTQIPNAIQTSYDGLGRPLRATTLYEGDPQHSSTVAYGGDWTLTRSGMSVKGATPLSGSRAARTWTDALGRTSKIQHFTTTDLTAITGTQPAAGTEPEDPPASIDTSYAYDPRGLLSQVTDADGNKWTYTYDVRGRMTSSTDPDVGAGYFGYDVLDRRTWTKDSRGRAQHTSYDVLGRQTELRDDSATGPLVAKWTYDTLPGAKGLPVASTRYNEGAAFTSEVTGYDQEYRPTGTRITIPSTPRTTGLAGTYTYGSTYTATGLLQSVDLPATPGGLAAEKVITRYDGEGSPRTTSGLAWYTAETVSNPFGQVLRTASGEAPNRVWSTSVYDQDTGRLVKSTTDRETLNPSRLSTLAYAYDTVGNITSVTDTQSATRVDRQCFAYDPMGRLAHAWTAKTPGCPRSSAAQDAGPDRADVSPSVDGAGYWHSYAFDAIGNRTGMKVHDLTDEALDDEYAYTYGSTPSGPLPAGTHQPHTLARVDATVRTPGQTVTSQSTYAYDASGNTTERVIGGDTQSLSWDRRNKLTSADTDDDGTPDVTYLYDASGNRLVEDDGTTRTLYLGEVEIVVTTAGTPVDARRYYTHPGAPTTVRSTGGKATGHKLTLVLTDHHNTGETAVDLAAGQAVTRRKFDPYGNPRGTEPTTWPDRRTFLGVGIDDPKTGLTHIGAREYDASTGRFISADPIIDIADPLQMNGYAYANQNPITNSDPTGLKLFEGNNDGGFDSGGCGGCNTAAKVHKLKYGSSDQSGYQSGYYDNPLPVRIGSAVVTFKNRKTFHKVMAKVEKKYPGVSRAYDMRNGCVRNDYGCVSELPFSLTVEYAIHDIVCFEDGASCDRRKKLSDVVAEATMDFYLTGGFVARGLMKPSKGSRPGRCPTGDSFVAGTEVLLADGIVKPIEELEVGDKVLATDPETGEVEAETVTATIFTADDKSYVDVTVSTEDGPKVIVATDHHPFWSESEKAWLDAGELKPGMTLRTDEGSTVAVNAVRAYQARQNTYNLTVADLHTYYVLAGQTPVLVHNSGPCGPAKGAVGEARAIQELQGRGYTIMGTHVKLEAKDGTISYVDVVATRNGPGLGAPEYFEVKNGPSARLSPPQKTVYGQLGDGGNVILRSDQLSSWGLKSGDLLPQADVNIILYGGAKAW